MAGAGGGRFDVVMITVVMAGTTTRTRSADDARSCRSCRRSCRTGQGRYGIIEISYRYNVLVLVVAVVVVLVVTVVAVGVGFVDLTPSGTSYVLTNRCLDASIQGYHVMVLMTVVVVGVAGASRCGSAVG